MSSNRDRFIALCIIFFSSARLRFAQVELFLSVRLRVADVCPCVCVFLFWMGKKSVGEKQLQQFVVYI